MKWLHQCKSSSLWLMGVLALSLLTIVAIGNRRPVYGASNTFCVDDYGANPTDSKEDTDAIVNALKEAMEGTDTVTITFNSGTYLINRPMYVYPNTHILLKDDTILRATANYNEGKGGTMFYGVHLNTQGWECFATTGCNHGGYSQCHDVLIEGGIYDGNWENQGARNSMMIFRHATGITLKNATLTHFTSHVVNISGSKNVLIQDCVFRDCEKYTGSENISYNCESIHFDYIAKNGENAHPADGTAPKNVLIKNCVFHNVKGGVGTHHPANDPTKVAENVRVIGCDFRGISGKYCVGFGECKNCHVEGCIYYDTDHRKLVKCCASLLASVDYTEKNNIATHPGSGLELLALSPSEATLYTAGDESMRTLTLKANLSGASFTSSDPSVASVTDSGVVTALKAGSAVITASIETEGVLQKATCNITVISPSLKVSPKKVTLYPYRTKQLKVTAIPEGSVTFKSSKKKVATVSKEGLITAKKKGSAKITVTCNGIKVKVKVTVQ